MINPFNIYSMKKFIPHFIEKVSDSKIWYVKRQLNKKNVVRTVIKWNCYKASKFQATS